MLELVSVTKRYDIRSVPAVFDLNLKVDSGEIFGFIGPNGAGKTTTIKMMTGLLEPTEGNIMICGNDIRREPLKCKSAFGYVPDSPEIYERLTGIEYLNFIADVFGVGSSDRKQRIEKYAEMFEMTGVLGSQVRSYSKGMKQKLAIVGSLIHSPSLWILDEPMMGLDPMASHALKEEMREQSGNGCTVFFSTHVLEVAEKLCDRVGIIQNGMLAAVGTVDELKSKASAGESSLEDIFIGIMHGEGNAYV